MAKFEVGQKTSWRDAEGNLYEAKVTSVKKAKAIPPKYKLKELKSKAEELVKGIEYEFNVVSGLTIKAHAFLDLDHWEEVILMSPVSFENSGLSRAITNEMEAGSPTLDGVAEYIWNEAAKTEKFKKIKDKRIELENLLTDMEQNYPKFDFFRDVVEPNKLEDLNP